MYEGIFYTVLNINYMCISLHNLSKIYSTSKAHLGENYAFKKNYPLDIKSLPLRPKPTAKW